MGVQRTRSRVLSRRSASLFAISSFSSSRLLILCKSEPSTPCQFSIAIECWVWRTSTWRRSFVCVSLTAPVVTSSARACKTSSLFSSIYDLSASFNTHRSMCFSQIVPFGVPFLSLGHGPFPAPPPL